MAVEKHLVQSGKHNLSQMKAAELAENCEIVFWADDQAGGGGGNVRLAETPESKPQVLHASRSRSPTVGGARSRRNPPSEDLPVLKVLDKTLSEHIQLTTCWMQKALDWGEELDKERKHLIEMKTELSKIIGDHEEPNDDD